MKDQTARVRGNQTYVVAHDWLKDIFRINDNLRGFTDTVRVKTFQMHQNVLVQTLDCFVLTTNTTFMKHLNDILSPNWLKRAN